MSHQNQYNFNYELDHDPTQNVVSAKERASSKVMLPPLN